MSFSFFDKNKMMALGAMGFCLTMVLFPEITATAAKEGVSLWLNSVVPMLFPFFVGANFLKRTGAVKRLSPRVYPFMMGALSGYPMGACTAGEYFRRGFIDRKQLLHILSYSMVTGPAFLIGAIGCEFLGAHRLGVILAVSHYTGAALNSFFYGSGGVRKGVTGRKRRTFGNSENGGIIRNSGNRAGAGDGGSLPRAGNLPGGIFERKKSAQARCKNDSESGFSVLTDAILESFRSIGIILAYIVLFMIAADLLQFSGALRFAPTACAAAVFKGMLEMTVGCSSLAACQCSPAVKTTLAAFIVTFGGFSVMGQTMSMLRNCSVKFSEIFVMKLSHGILSAIIAFSICSFVL